MPSRKLLGAFGNRSVAKSKKAQRVSSAATAATTMKDMDDDPLKLMQDRMLHRAIHNRSAATAWQPPASFPTRAQLDDKTSTQSKVTPPRGTLSDEKLPYLDWRLSMLHLEQVKIDEQRRALRRAAAHQQQHEGIASSLARSSLSEQSAAVAAADQRSSGSSASRCDTELSTSRKLSNAIEHPIDIAYSTLHGADGGIAAWQQTDLVPVSIDLEQGIYYSKEACYYADDALAGVPVLSKNVLLERALPAGQGHRRGESEEEVDDEDHDSDEQYYDADDRRDNDDSLVSLPASILKEGQGHSTMHRSGSGSGSSGSSSSRRKITSFFSRGNRSRPLLPNRSQSHGCLEDAAGHGKEGVAVNNLYYSPAKGKKWSLLALNQMAVRDAATFG